MISEKLQTLLECVIRQASKEDVGFTGFILSSESGDFRHFGNLTEQGNELAHVHRLLADSVEEAVSTGNYSFQKLSPEM